MKKKIVLIILNFVILISIVNNCNFHKKKNYNIVLIVIDTLRADHLPFYGYKKNTAPFINKISKESIVFKHAFSASSWTTPATASIFTSLYPFQHGVLMCLLAIKRAKRIDPNIIINRIPEKIITISEILKKNGYSTYGISDNLNIGALEGFTQGFDKFETYGYKKAPFITEKILQWKKEILKQNKYFLFIQFMDPHAPYHRRIPWYKPKQNLKAEMISRYDSEINFVDYYIEKLYKEFGWDKNTLLIITADHGEGLWDHGHMDHGQSLFLEEIHVPLLMHYPVVKKSKKIHTIVSTIDILPTVTDIIGIPKLKNWEGKSLLPLINNKKNKLMKRYIYSYLWKKINNTIEYKSTLYGKWHYIINPNGEQFLFNMAKDSKEKVNLFSKRTKISNLLRKKFINFFLNSKRYTYTSIKFKLSKQKIKKLKSLGYVQ